MLNDLNIHRRFHLSDILLLNCGRLRSKDFILTGCLRFVDSVLLDNNPCHLQHMWEGFTNREKNDA